MCELTPLKRTASEKAFADLKLSVRSNDTFAHAGHQLMSLSNDYVCLNPTMYRQKHTWDNMWSDFKVLFGTSVP